MSVGGALRPAHRVDAGDGRNAGAALAVRARVPRADLRALPLPEADARAVGAAGREWAARTRAAPAAALPRARRAAAAARSGRLTPRRAGLHAGGRDRAGARRSARRLRRPRAVLARERGDGAG